jgi:hypothetical protein
MTLKMYVLADANGEREHGDAGKQRYPGEAAQTWFSRMAN